MENMTMAKNSNAMVDVSNIDMAALSVTQLEEMLKVKKAQQAKLAVEKGLEARKDVEEYVQRKYGLSLAQVWLANKKKTEPKTYKNPADDKLYTYSGKGKVPSWLKIGGTGKDAKKPNPAYEVKTN